MPFESGNLQRFAGVEEGRGAGLASPRGRVMCRRLFSILAALLALAAACTGVAQQPTPATAAAHAGEPQSTDSAVLYLFNDSGRTLVPGNQVVTDNGVRLASLPRLTYVRLQIAPGLHLLKPDPPLWKQEVRLDAVAGGRYFVVVAYRPERSWSAPLAGAPLILREITQEQAAPLLKEMTAQ